MKRKKRKKMGSSTHILLVLSDLSINRHSALYRYFQENVSQNRNKLKNPLSFIYVLSNRKPSILEKKEMTENQIKLAVTKKHLAEMYCILILGLGMSDQHHMACGK